MFFLGGSHFLKERYVERRASLLHRTRKQAIAVPESSVRECPLVRHGRRRKRQLVSEKMRIQTAVVRTSQLRREFFLSIGTRAGGLLDRTEVERMAEFLIIQD